MDTSLSGADSPKPLKLVVAAEVVRDGTNAHQCTRACVASTFIVDAIAMDRKNHLFSGRRYIASAPSLSSTAELSKSCGLVGVLNGRVEGAAEIAGARGAGDRAARANSE